MQHQISRLSVMDGGLGFLDQLPLQLAEQTKLPVRPHTGFAESRPGASHSCFRAVCCERTEDGNAAFLLSSLNHHASSYPHTVAIRPSRGNRGHRQCTPGFLGPPRPAAEVTGQIQGLCVASMRPRGGSGSRERIIGTATSAVCWRHFLCFLSRTQAEHFAEAGSRRSTTRGTVKSTIPALLAPWFFTPSTAPSPQLPPYTHAHAPLAPAFPAFPAFQQSAQPGSPNCPPSASPSRWLRRY